jgi:hypothetical protein
MKRYAISLLFLWLWGCGGAAVKIEKPTKAPEDDASKDSEDAIAVVRASLDAMGGLERLRLIGAKATIKATASSGGETLPIEIALGGPDRWRFDYVDGGISYIYSRGICRKIAYGIPARCTPSEEKWMEPSLLLQGLIFPASDAANLGAAFRSKVEKTVEGDTIEAQGYWPKLISASPMIRAAKRRTGQWKYRTGETWRE